MKRRRILAALLALVMVLSTTTAIFAKDWSGSGTFEDVGKNDWFHGYVENLADQKIVKGYGNTGEYRPVNTLSREEAAKMIAEAAGLTASPGFKSSFIDLDDVADWALPYVYALEEAGVIKGFGDTDEFRPKLPIERGHIAKMLVKAFGLEEGPLPVNLADLDLVEKDPEVLEAIRILASNGIVSGFGTSNEFRPLDYIDRAAFAKVIAIAQATAAVQQAEKDDATPEDIERARKLVSNLPDDQDKETKESLEERLDELEEEEDEPGPGPVDPDPIQVSAINIEGNAVVGEKLTATPDPAEATGSYQWMKADSADGTYEAIDGATARTYMVQEGDKFIKVKFTATGSYTGTPESEVIEVEEVPEIGFTDIGIAIRGEGPATGVEGNFNYAYEYAAAGITFDANTHTITLNEDTFIEYLATTNNVGTLIKDIDGTNYLFVGLEYTTPYEATKVQFGEDTPIVIADSEFTHGGKYIGYFAFAKAEGETYVAMDSKAFGEVEVKWLDAEDKLVAKQKLNVSREKVPEIGFTDIGIAIRGEGPATGVEGNFNYAYEYAAAGITFDANTHTITLNEDTFIEYLATTNNVGTLIKDIDGTNYLFVGLEYTTPDEATKVQFGEDTPIVIADSEFTHGGKYIGYFAFAKAEGETYVAMDSKAFGEVEVKWLDAEDKLVAKQKLNVSREKVEAAEEQAEAEALARVNAFIQTGTFNLTNVADIEADLATLGLNVGKGTDFEDLDETEEGGKERKTAVFRDLNWNRDGDYDLETLTRYFNEMVATRLITQEAMNLVMDAKAKETAETGTGVADLQDIPFVTLQLNRFKNEESAISYPKHSNKPLSDKVAQIQPIYDRYDGLDGNTKTKVLEEFLSYDFARADDTLTKFAAAMDAVEAAEEQAEAEALARVNAFIQTGTFNLTNVADIEADLATLGLNVGKGTDFEDLDETEEGGKERKTAVFRDLNWNRDGDYDLETLTRYFNEMVATRLITQEAMNLVMDAKAKETAETGTGVADLQDIPFVTLQLNRFKNEESAISYPKHSNKPLSDKVAQIQPIYDRYDGLDGNTKTKVLEEFLSYDFARADDTLTKFAAAMDAVEAIDSRVAIGNLFVNDVKEYKSSSQNKTFRILSYSAALDIDANDEGKVVNDTTLIRMELYNGATLLGWQKFNETGRTKYGTSSSFTGDIDVAGDYISTSWDHEWNGEITDIPDKAVAIVTYTDGGTARVEKALTFAEADTKILFAAKGVYDLFVDAFVAEEQLALKEGVDQATINAAQALVNAVTVKTDQNKVVLQGLIDKAQVLLGVDGKVINTTQNKGYDTIKAALDAALENDVIIVAAGEYEEDLTQWKNGITLKSAEGAEATTITGNHSFKNEFELDAQWYRDGVSDVTIDHEPVPGT